MSFDVRLVAYAPNGARLGLLPHPMGLSAGFPLNDLSALSFAYPAALPGAAYLAGPCEIALEWSANGSAWVEPDGARFLRIKRSDDSTDATGMVKYDCPGYGWLLRKARLWPSAFDNAEGKRVFAAVSVGTILATLINEAKARGALAGLVTDFSTTVDSAGAAWDTTLSITYEPGVDLQAVLLSLADQGVLDWTLAGRTLRVFNADTTLARDRTTITTPVDLRLGRDIVEAPDTATWEDLVTDVLVVGEGGARLELNNPAVVGPWGRWETLVAQGGVSDTGTMTVLAQAALERSDGERVQYTRGLTLTAQARFLPWRDYRPGDFVSAPDDTGALARLRLRQVTISRDDTGYCTGAAVLNDRFLERDIAIARRVAAITGAATAGGSGAPPTPPAPEGSEGDTLAPGQVTGLLATTAAYLDPDGAARAQVSLSWQPVTTSADGTATGDIERYSIYGRVNQAGQVWRALATVDHPDTTVSISPFDVGSVWSFKVRAVDRVGNAGAFSTEAVVTMAADATPPPVPSTPVLTSKLGTLKVAWDGKTSAAGVMPPDFDRVEVHVSTVNNFTPGTTTLVDTLRAPGAVVLPTLDPTQTYRAKFIAVDRSGNASAASAQGTGTIVRITGPDLLANSVTANEVDGGSVRAEILIAGVITSDMVQIGTLDRTRLAGGTGTNLLVDGGFETASYWTGRLAESYPDAATRFTHAVTGARTGTGCVVSPAGVTNPVGSWLTPSRPCKVGDRIFVSAWARSATAAVSEVRAFVNWYDSAGARITTSLCVVAATPADGSWVADSGIGIAPVGAVSYRVDLYKATGKTQVRVDDVMVAEALGEGDHNDDRISITPGGIDVLQGDDLRLRIDQDGLRAWAPGVGGALTFDIDAATGDVFLSGDLETSGSGRRVVVSHTAQSGRAGIVMDTGMVGWTDGGDIFVEDGTTNVSNPWEPGSLVLTSPEVTPNSSGRSDLYLHPDEWKIGHNWGTGGADIYGDRAANKIVFATGTVARFEVNNNEVRTWQNLPFHGDRLKGGRGVTGGDGAQAGTLQSGKYLANEIWFSWGEGYFRLWVDQTNVATITGDGRFL